MFLGHGNVQLFIRGSIQATGVPIHFARFFYKSVEFAGTAYSGDPLDYTANFLNACLLIPISSWSLFHQWKHTSAGSTGHPASDAFERDNDPNVDNREERIKVTIINAKGLRKADLNGKSDPYCICSVSGRPESKFQTNVIPKTLDPEWNESGELPLYRAHDSLDFVVRDHDEVAKAPCCKFFDDGDDLLGTVTLTAADLHPNGFEGEVNLTHCGRHKHAVLTLKIEFLGSAEPSQPTEAIVPALLGKDLEDVVDMTAEQYLESVKEVRDAAATVETAVENEVRTAEAAVAKDLAKIGIAV